MSEPGPTFRFGSGRTFELHNAKLGYRLADGAFVDANLEQWPRSFVFPRHLERPEQHFTFSPADFSINATVEWVYPTLSRRQLKQITALLFGRKRHSNKIEHAIKRRQSRELARLRKRYPGIGEAFDHIVEDLNYIGEIKIPSDDAADV